MVTLWLLKKSKKATETEHGLIMPMVDTIEFVNKGTCAGDNFSIKLISMMTRMNRYSELNQP